MSKQTAVEWLIEQMINQMGIRIENTTNGIELFEQAKAMEKQQSISDYCEGFKVSGEGWNGEYGLTDMLDVAGEINAEQYYNEMYGSKENSSTPMLDRLKAHLDSITSEQLAQEFDEIQEWFQCGIEDCPHCAEDIAQMQDEDDDDLTDDELIIKDLYREKQQHAIDFAKWLAQDWMAIWVVDKWMWENVDGLASKNYKHNGMYYTEEELYELYLKSE